jgi:hypothetical protein
VVTTKEEAAKYQTGGATLEECMQVCKPESTQPGEGGQPGQEQDPGYCYNGQACIYVPSIQDILSKNPNVCCGQDMNSCQSTCIQQQNPNNPNDPNDPNNNETKTKKISVNVALEKPETCVGGIVDVLAHVKNSGNVDLSDARLIVYGGDSKHFSQSDYFNIKAGEVKDLPVKIECVSPLRAFV